MAERPVPDTDTLAAETRRLLDACPSQGTVDYYTDALHRAYDERDDLAARLAAITAAIGDPDELLLWVRQHNSIMLRQRVLDILDAASLSPTPTPKEPT